MDLTMVDLGSLADPLRCSEAEPTAIEAARFFAELPEHFERHLPVEQVVARNEFIRAVAAHWPAGSTQPHEIILLLKRYGNPDVPGV